MFEWHERELLVAAGRGLRADEMVLLLRWRVLALRVFDDLVRSA